MTGPQVAVLMRVGLIAAMVWPVTLSPSIRAT
jgi:hypothetical protein